MLKFFGGRVAPTVAGLLMLGLGSAATAQDVHATDVTAQGIKAPDMSTLGNVSAAVKAVTLDTAVKAVAADTAVKAVALNSAVKPIAADATSILVRPLAAIAVRAAPLAGTLIAAQRAPQHSLATLASSVATEAAWLYKSGWPLYALVDKYSAGAAFDEQTNCLATAVYFEARGESLEGQLAVARVVMNRAASGRYPSDWCSVIKQHAQFSFVRHGAFPYVDTASGAWARAEGVTRLAVANVVPSIEPDVLWYHANYVAPSWRQRLSMVEKIGAHIFYRA